jgi:non-ribosomal peptide synthetase component F
MSDMSRPDAALLAEQLPGADLVARGLQAWARGEGSTVEALLIAMLPERLAALGLAVPVAAFRVPDAHLRLFALLGETYGDGAHVAYNALQRRVDKYVRVVAAGLPA